MARFMSPQPRHCEQSEAIHSLRLPGLLRRFAPRNDNKKNGAMEFLHGADESMRGHRQQIEGVGEA
jgi:hypothetical protein